MKILNVTTGLNNGGAEGALTRLVLADRDNRHEVVSLLGDGAFGQLLRDQGIPVHSLDIRNPYKSARSFFSLIGILRRAKPDVVQCWMYHANLFGGLASLLAGVRNVAWNLRTVPNEWLSSRSHLIIDSGARLSKIVPKVIVCAGDEVGIAHRNRGYDAEKLVAIGNGIDTNRFAPDLARGLALRQALGIGSDEWLVGRVARDVAQKDHRTLFNALAGLDRRGQAVRCLLVGHGMEPSNTSLRDLAIETGVDHLLIYAGHRTDVEAVSNAIDLFVSSSRVEGFPNAIAEAMACETPVVATDAGASATIVGQVGDVVPVGDGAGLGDAIAKARDLALARPEAWLARGKASRERIVAEFSMDSMVRSYQGVWQATASRRRVEPVTVSLEPAS